MKARHKRLGFLTIGIVALGLSTWLVVNALGSNLSYFFSPSEVAEGAAPSERIFRLGGLVKPDSVERGEELLVRFQVTDHAHDVTVVYSGILPDLFAEGQGVVAQGRLNEQGQFVAERVLAKHDENYMAPEVKEALARAHADGVAQEASTYAAAESSGSYSSRGGESGAYSTSGVTQ